LKPDTKSGLMATPRRMGPHLVLLVDYRLIKRTTQEKDPARM
jgi:hypothetical protein